MARNESANETGRSTAGARPGWPAAFIGVGLALVAAAAVVAAFAASPRGESEGEMPGKGDSAPKFKLASTTGEEVSLEEFEGESNVLLYFYEHAG